MLNISYLHFISLAFVFIYMSCLTNSATQLYIKLFKHLSNKKFLDKLILMRFLLKLQNTNIIFNDFLVIFIVNSIFMTNFEASSQVVSPDYI